MEQDQELIANTTKHVCKFCSKSFPCGRSLGGHMRSHVVTNLSSLSEADHEEKEKEKLKPSSLSSSHEAGTNNNNTSSSNTGYGLRENPKKTWRMIADSAGEDTLLMIHDKLCKECGKGFPSWKALFGHMKCHSSEKEKVSSINNNKNNSLLLEDQDSWTNTNNNNNGGSSFHHHQKLVMDSQSDNEATAPSRRRRSKRRTRRYAVAASAATSNSVSLAANPSSSSLSEVEQEQEEVAMSLMMLSRDVGPWSGLHSVAESSDNNSGYCFEVKSSSVRRIESNKKHTLNESEVGKLIKQSDNKLEFGNSVSKRKSSELFSGGFIKSETALDDSGAENGKSRVNGTEPASTTNKYSSIKAKFSESELRTSSLKSCVKRPSSEAEFSKNCHKRGKFECTTCNRIFHSYQALGGHRASHKKIKGCFASRNNEIESSTENSIETDELMMKKNKSVESEEHVVEHEAVVGGAGFDSDLGTPNSKSKVHECPICLKVFSSGQALGGHKRSHMAGGSSESRNFQTIVLKEEAVPEIRDLLDLNLPAADATEEESNSHADSNRPWWLVQSNHKQEAMVGLNV